MRLVTFRRAPHAPAQPGVIAGDQVVPLESQGIQSLLHLLELGEAGLDRARTAASNPSGSVVPLSGVQLLAPLQRPPKLICVGLNYRDHAEESNMQIPAVPTIFNKFATSIIGPGDQIVLPKKSTQPDYEAEFAVVIGKGGRHIAESDWQKHIAGYTIVNDVSARDIQLATTQWLMGKTFDTFAPIGPYITTADEIADPHNLDISLEIDGEVLQNSNTKHLIFNLPTLISYLSSVFTLEPGDIISTGTPAGVGFARKPPRYLKAGDNVTVKVQGLGELTNPVVAE